MADDLALAHAAAHGSERALRELLARVSGQLRSIAWHMTYDHHESQDLCQEALLRITTPEVLKRYRGDGPLDGFAVQVGIRAMLSARRTRRFADARDVVPTDSSAPFDGAAATAPEVGSLDPDLHAALLALPVQARLVVVLITVGDYSYQDVAAFTGLRLGTVKSIYSRARAALRRALADHPAALQAEGS